MPFPTSHTATSGSSTKVAPSPATACLGGQLDARLTPRLSATLQARLAPSTDSDSGWDPTLSWAFISWRPADDFMLRAGKLRMPYMLDTENHDVGVTYPYARLPTEVYATAPTSDIYGLMLARNLVERSWRMDSGWLLRAHRVAPAHLFAQRSRSARAAGRATTRPGCRAAVWCSLCVTTKIIYRLGLHRIRTERRSGTIIADFPFTYCRCRPTSPERASTT
jgi:hypothetical protein